MNKDEMTHEEIVERVGKDFKISKFSSNIKFPFI